MPTSETGTWIFVDFEWDNSYGETNNRVSRSVLPSVSTSRPGSSV